MMFTNAEEEPEKPEAALKIRMDLTRRRKYYLCPLSAEATLFM